MSDDCRHKEFTPYGWLEFGKPKTPARRHVYERHCCSGCHALLRIIWLGESK